MIWLVVNGFLKSAKFDELAQMFAEAAAKRTLELKVKRNSEILADTGEREPDLPEAVIFWDKDVLLARYLEIKGIPVFNSSHCIRVCDDKRRTHLQLLQEGIPMPRTVFAPMTYDRTDFSDVEFLHTVETRLGFPLVVKEAFGSFGEQVYLAGDREDLRRAVEMSSTTEILFQEYIGESRGRDVRLQVVGDRVIAAMYRHSETDFRANITAGGRMEAYTPDDGERELACAAARAVGADFAGVDLLFSRRGPIVCEVNSNAHFKNLLDCTGVNTADSILEYVEGMVCRR